MRTKTTTSTTPRKPRGLLAMIRTALGIGESADVVAEVQSLRREKRLLASEAAAEKHRPRNGRTSRPVSIDASPEYRELEASPAYRELEALAAETEQLRAEKIQAMESVAAEREGRAKAEASALMREFAGCFNRETARLFRPWLERACVDQHVTIPKDELIAFVAAQPNLAAVVGPNWDPALKRDQAVEDDAALDAQIQELVRAEGIPYTEAFTRITGKPSGTMPERLDEVIDPRGGAA